MELSRLAYQKYKEIKSDCEHHNGIHTARFIENEDLHVLKEVLQRLKEDGYLVRRLPGAVTYDEYGDEIQKHYIQVANYTSAQMRNLQDFDLGMECFK